MNELFIENHGHSCSEKRLKGMRLSRQGSQAPEQLLEFAEVLVARVASPESFDRVCRTLWPNCLIEREGQTLSVLPFGQASAESERENICFRVEVGGI